jgi:hypothetical protein
MYVEITKGGSGTLSGELCEAADLKRFSVHVGADCPDELVTNWLAASGAGHRAGDDVAISVQWLRQRTAERPAEWQDGFQKMLDYAATKGWMDDARTVVTAHVETV